MQALNFDEFSKIAQISVSRTGIFLILEVEQCISFYKAVSLTPSEKSFQMRLTERIVRNYLQLRTDLSDKSSRFCISTASKFS
jgi:hypothetical protein